MWGGGVVGKRYERVRRAAVAVLLLSSVLLAARSPRPARASSVCDTIFGNRYTGGSPRVLETIVDDVRMVVVLPPDYATSQRRYPTVFLLPGGISPPDDYITATDLLDFTESQPANRQAIVVLLDFVSGRLFTNWRDGRYQGEDEFVNRIVPAIDARFRTIADGRHRAIAGYSASGLASVNLAVHHPDLFAALGTLSSITHPDEHDAVITGIVVAGAAAFTGDCFGPADHADPFAFYGDPVNDALWWHNAGGVDGAINFRGMRVSLFTQTGVPCDQRDVTDLVTDKPPFGFVEPELQVQAERFDTALATASVDHSWTYRACGIHTYRYIEQDLHDWWGSVFAAFETSAPARFDFRRADARFTVWQWSFTADPGRAGEFLDVQDAACDGLTLRGSGVETVTTAPCFAPGQSVSIDDGVRRMTRTATSDGRVTFTVELGRAHTLQQMTVAEQLVETTAGPNYWTTRHVTLR